MYYDFDGKEDLQPRHPRRARASLRLRRALSDSDRNRSGHRLVDVGGIDNGGAGHDGLGRQLGAEVDVRVEQRHGEEALQVGLLVDREELSAVLDAVEIGLTCQA